MLFLYEKDIKTGAGCKKQPFENAESDIAFLLLNAFKVKASADSGGRENKKTSGDGRFIRKIAFCYARES